MSSFQRRRRLAGVLALVVMVAVGAGTPGGAAPPAGAPAAAGAASPNGASPAGTTATVLGGTPRPVPAGWRRTFAEEFDRPLRATRWNRCHWWDDGGCTIASNHEQQWYLPDNTDVVGGHLRLEAREEAVEVPGHGSFTHTSGMVTTGPPRYRTAARYAFRYGYVEARLRLPAGAGLWPAFWLLPADQVSRPEIDVVEVLGDDPRGARFHYHWVGVGGARRSLGHRWSGPDLTAGWHRFAVDWRPGEITWIVDGRARWRVRGPAVAAERLYLVLNLAVGGDYPGPPDDATGFPAAVEVDWVRVSRPS